MDVQEKIFDILLILDVICHLLDHLRYQDSGIWMWTSSPFTAF